MRTSRLCLLKGKPNYSCYNNNDYIVPKKRVIRYIVTRLSLIYIYVFNMMEYAKKNIIINLSKEDISYFFLFFLLKIHINQCLGPNHHQSDLETCLGHPEIIFIFESVHHVHLNLWFYNKYNNGNFFVFIFLLIIVKIIFVFCDMRSNLVCSYVFVFYI